jgi:cytochrome c peroxidase
MTVHHFLKPLQHKQNQGKIYFLTPPTFNANGVRTRRWIGCAGCHRAPEFDITPNTRNNGIIGTISDWN